MELKLTSTLAIVSIRRDRKKLAKLIVSGGTVPITLRGTITNVWGASDNVDQEFEMDVEELTVHLHRKPRKAAR